MKAGFVISMYDESEIVLDSIKKIRSYFLNKAIIVVVHSDNKENSSTLEQIIQYSNSYIKLENLSQAHDEYTLPAAAICRNYSVGFSKLKNILQEADVIVGLTGDTRIFDCKLLEKYFNNVKLQKVQGYVLRAIGQNFHKSTDSPSTGIGGNRLQTFKNNDFMPQFFIFNGLLLTENSLFCKIKNTNKYTSEQSLGDEVQNKLGNKKFSDCIPILNSPVTYAYGFNSGVQLQVKGLGHTRKEYHKK